MPRIIMYIHVLSKMSYLCCNIALFLLYINFMQIDATRSVDEVYDDVKKIITELTT